MQLFKTIFLLILLSGNAFTDTHPAYIPSRVVPYQKWINRYSKLYKVNPDIIEAMIAIESSYQPWITGDDDESQGLMQIQVPSAKERGFRGTSSQLRNPRLNIKYGTKYYSWLRHTWKLDVYNALDAYNRGIGRVTKRPYKGKWEKHKYVGKILIYLNKKNLSIK